MIATNPDAVFCPYDVGDVLTTSSPTLPSERWPGTEWYQIKDCFLLAAGDSHPAGSSGGEEFHVLTQNELPMYAYGACYSGNSNEEKSYGWMTNSGNAMAYGNLRLGQGWAHNNMPPYKAYYMWERTK